ncbi:MAG: TetR/AcrR family transcriptional regulator [Pseudomonadales bacterium]|nr:TetR/AcrR family transcriptional regulator [Pseudomonadales bacterium]
MAPAPRYSPEQQQKMIISAAAICIEKSSLLDFTMSAISKETGLSMGSIYKHIQSKEDVLLALATDMFGHMHDMFTEIMQFELPIAERLLALQLFCPKKAQLFSFDAPLRMLVNNDAILQRASSAWIEKMNRADIAVEDMINTQLQNALDAGAMKACDESEQKMANEIHLGLWSLCVGFQQVAHQRHSRHQIHEDIELPFPLAVEHSIIQASKRFLNSFPWLTPASNQGLEKACAMLVEKHYR